MAKGDGCHASTTSTLSGHRPGATHSARDDGFRRSQVRLGGHARGVLPGFSRQIAALSTVANVVQSR